MLSGFFTKSLTKGAEHDAAVVAAGGSTAESQAEPHFEVSLMLLCAYASYVVAESLALSGIMSLFFCGICMSPYTKYNLSGPAVHTASHSFRISAFLSEACVFAYLGFDFVLADWSSTNGHFHWRFIGLTILACLVSRACNIFPLAFLMNSTCRKTRQVRSITLEPRDLDPVP